MIVTINLDTVAKLFYIICDALLISFLAADKVKSGLL